MDGLRAIGAEVLRLREHLPADAPDEAVSAAAQRLEAILVSVNGDFANIVTYPPARCHGIIALQAHNHPEIIPQLLARLTNYITFSPRCTKTGLKGHNMARSQWKTPIRSITTALSKKMDKQSAHRRYRRKVKAVLQQVPEAGLFPHVRERSDPWRMGKDGKARFDPTKHPKDMRQ